MNYQRVSKLEVFRKLSDATNVAVGTLAQNSQGTFFQYKRDYLQQFNNLSPFNLSFDSSLQLAPRRPHAGLHGAFSDSLPDGWGLLLMGRVFRQKGILPTQITAMDRLSFVGRGGMGALSYLPVSELKQNSKQQPLSISQLGLQAQALFDGQTSEVLQALINAGSSGGARPKAQLYLNHKNDFCSIEPIDDGEAFLVKFTSSQLALGHDEGVCEAAYLSMAKQANIDVPEWRLLDAPHTSGARQWLAVKRFDLVKNRNGEEGRLHMHSASGLLDADYKMPSLDYEDLIKVSSLICRSPAVGQAMFRRMVFNLFALNQDDHSKNWAFLQQDSGQWQLAPFYDVTFSPSSYGEHATAFCGFGNKPSLKAMQKLAIQANFSNWGQARIVLEEVVEAIHSFKSIANDLPMPGDIAKLIIKQLNINYKENSSLLKSK
ncbi:type II toxin-antitoxin system HipA family toxin [Psychromonas sp. Urea-02u-13]|uniref:type II toxin-antitoxin system HipA family toxin n=1 Tax=Psychromonas sp. Urea-02u-13 TaxID=2058326 RepID=UPI000C33801B|nr:type II toxin-antitoxin system HipA family toxin [Psychromonas sp. Urea-02u-13]PKG37509.1 type II toxin-antitoxin system HipA family toxin [Psychromonas sp. Urea-02u-13]